MNFFPRPAFATGEVGNCAVLRRNLSGLTSLGVAVLGVEKGGLAIGTRPGMNEAERRHRSVPVLENPGSPSVFSVAALDQSDLDRLEEYAGPNIPHGRWHAFNCRFESGTVDQIVVALAENVNESRALEFLSMIWPVLREDCLREVQDLDATIGDEALLWMIAQKIDVAVVVVNARGLMLRLNTAARQLLESGHVLCRGHGGLHGINDEQTRLLREAIARCAKSPVEHSETVLFLDTATCGHRATATYGQRVPVTLSRFMHDGAPTDLVTVMLPSPPDQRRVEMLAREMGLTQAEARVASLMQMGLSNRDAAAMAGLKEQTFSTYAKRVLSKLSVTSRAEMAQLLTWQARGGRMS